MSPTREIIKTPQVVDHPLKKGVKLLITMERTPPTRKIGAVTVHGILHHTELDPKESVSAPPGYRTMVVSMVPQTLHRYDEYSTTPIRTPRTVVHVYKPLSPTTAKRLASLVKKAHSG